jgi:hypothetical protein
MALRSGKGNPLKVIEDGSPPEDPGEPLLSWMEGDRPGPALSAVE